MILEASADQVLAISEQSGRKCVAGMAFEGVSVEGEAERAAAVDAAAGRQAMGLGHGVGTGTSSPDLATVRISWVTVWRTTFSHCRQPAAWCHHSRCQPFGLARSYV